MKTTLWRAFIGLLFLSVWQVAVAQPQTLPGHVPRTVSRLAASGRLPANLHLELVIGLPLRNQKALTNLLDKLYDPASQNFRRYLTPDQFTQQFGPLESDYQALIDFARANGLTVTGVHPGRTLLDVNGSVADIERMFHVTLRTYQHPTEARAFFSPDSEPSIDLNIPVLHVSGLDNYEMPRPHVHGFRNPTGAQTLSIPNGGSGTNGEYWGYDFRAAYTPGTTLTGAGQTVALYELEGYLASDITSYENQSGLPNVTVQNVPIKGFSFVPNNSDALGVLEVCLDIEVAIAMAPGLSRVMVYGATNGFNFDQNILQQIADDNAARQISSSWGINVNASIDQIFKQFAAQGQSFFMAAGDSDAYVGAIAQGVDDPYITVVGGTTLTTGAFTNWQSEVVWNNNNSGSIPVDAGSSGGISTTYAIPLWQQGINMTSNQGSTGFRNIPDVAMIGNNVETIASGGITFYTSGTSIAAPLWAGLTALVNQQASADDRPPVGFLNPALYALGTGPGYSAEFHDITVGNNTNTISPTRFPATAGYDLCTGWGTPTVNLITGLENFAGTVWVDFNSVPPGLGTYDTPYATLPLGISGVALGGTVAMKGPNSTAISVTITNHLTLNAYNGAVTIGH
jgi:subtilase family serine protease